MAQISGYKEELQDELQKTDPNSHASRLLAQEIDRLQKGDDRKDNKSTSFVDVHHNQPQNVVLNVRIPTREHPRFNFVGKLIGPKGATMKRLQEETGCKMSVLGKGSMRDKAKEEELRKEGGKKNAHLSEELHVRVEVFAEMAEGYRRLSGAITELRKFLIPENNDDIHQQQMQDMGMYQEDGRAPARGGFRGGPAGRGGPPSAGRGAPMRGGAAPPGRGAPPPGRGAPRGGGAPLIRGTPPTRGRGGAPPPSRAPPAQAPAYDEYGYGNSERESGYDDGYSRREYAESSYAQRQRGGSGYDDGYSSRDYAESSYRNSGYAEDQGDSQYYGRSRREPSSSAAGGYETYSYDYGHGDSWGAGGSSYGPMKSSGGSGAPKPRSHPYSSGY